MKYRALITAEIEADVIGGAFPDISFDVEGYCKNHVVMDSEALSEIIEPYDILISEFETVNKKVLDRAKNLKLIICNRGGVKSVIDIESARKRNIVVEHNAGRNANAVSEIVMGYILDFCRNISKSNQMVHDGSLFSESSDIPKEYGDNLWGFGDSSPYQSLRGRSPSMMTLGIVGYGNAGRAVAGKAKAFGMDIVISDPMDSSLAKSLNLKKLSLDELLSVSDVVSMHCPMTSETKDMIGTDQFKLMKKDALFINAARGGVVNEDALITALESGEIASAVIDVAKKEPILPNSRLLKTPNLVITPHIAGASDEVVKRGTEMTIKTLMHWLGMDLVM